MSTEARPGTPDGSARPETRPVAYPRLGPVGAPGMVVFRNYLSYRAAWKLFLTGFLEPIFFLFSIGIGVGQMVQDFTFRGEQIEFAAFVAPAMLATSAMNGAMMDCTFNVFFKLKHDKLYDQMLATPLTPGDVTRGEIAWGLVRGSIYSTFFLLVMIAMGLVSSWWALLAVPAAILLALAFSAVFMAITTFMTTWQHLEWVTLLQLPMFLFSATFFPVTVYEGALRWLVEATPLYRGVVLLRELTTGALSEASVVSVVYLVVMALVGLSVVRRRLDGLLRT